MKKLGIIFLAVGLVLTAASTMLVHASDHDDGEIDLKGRNLNLTDLYVFKEGDQSGVAADNDNIIFVMNTNPRSMAGFQYHFSTQARYEFHITNVAAQGDAATGKEDTLIRFTFDAPDAADHQAMTVTAVKAGATHTAKVNSAGGPLTTTNYKESRQDTLGVHSFTLDGKTLTLFAGLREDPFFFDVENYFRQRASALTGLANPYPFPARNFPVDFTAGYNVNSIVLRVPKTFLGSATVLDVWQTISVPKT